MKPRTCEHCNTVIPLDRGFYFDKDLNLTCGTCDKVVCPTKEKEAPKSQGIHQHGGFL